MKNPTHQITELEKRVQLLSQELMHDHKTRTERNRLESELRVAQQALEQYESISAQDR
jgi:hypothetical protein